jgi:flagellar assembly protein FliH
MSAPTISQEQAYRPIPFNFCDLERKAQDYLNKVKEEALQVATKARDEVAKMRDEAQKELAFAKQEAARVRQQGESLDKRLAEEHTVLDARRKEVEETARKNGYETGYKSGYDEGRQKGYSDGEVQAMTDYAEKVRREAEIQLAGKIETLMPALQTAVQNIETVQQSFLTHWEKCAVRVATAIAQRAISRQLPEMVDVPLRLLREALELAVGCTQMKIRLNPTDYETLQPQIDLLIAELSGAAATEVVPDHKASPGGCVIETSLGKIDQRIESRLDRIQMELV